VASGRNSTLRRSFVMSLELARLSIARILSAQKIRHFHWLPFKYLFTA
jgi:hypothetical protein